MRKIVFILIISGLSIGTLFWVLKRVLPLAKPIDEYQGVSVYPNGDDFTKSHGRHFHWSGYYFGQKWQCVEFIKRFYFLHKGHQMPNVWGHALDFFDPQIPHGSLNPERGLVQFYNGYEIPPQADDLIVFQELTNYGHVAIVTEVTSDTVEVIQQNVLGKTRMQFPLQFRDGGWWVGDTSLVATGWLRVQSL